LRLSGFSAAGLAIFPETDLPFLPVKVLQLFSVGFFVGFFGRQDFLYFSFVGFLCPALVSTHSEAFLLFDHLPHRFSPLFFFKYTLTAGCAKILVYSTGMI